MKKTSFFVLVLIILSNQTSYAGSVFSENFTANPGWTSTVPDNVKWDSAGFYRAKVTDNPTGWAQWGYSPIFQEVNGSFTFEFSMNPASTSWGTYPLIALNPEGTANPYEQSSLDVEAHWSDDAYNKFAIFVPGNNRWYTTTSFDTGIDTGKWYSHKIEYNKDALTLSWDIAEVGQPEGSFYSGQMTNVSLMPYNQVAVGYQGGQPVYGSWAEIYVDNITIIPEPATICLLTLGSLALRLRSGRVLRKKRI